MIHVGELKEELIQYAKEIGVDKIRFASADTFDSLKDRLILHESLGYLSGFEEPDIEKRTNPSLLLPKAKSIVAIALAYPSKMKDAPRSTKDARRGIFCRASWGTDYHVVLKKSSICSRNSCEANMSIYEQNQWWIQGSCPIVQ